MKTNTTLKIVTLCVICAVTLMAGCIDDIQDSIADRAVEEISEMVSENISEEVCDYMIASMSDGLSEDIKFAATFDSDSEGNRLYFVLIEGGMAAVKINDMTTVGTWELYMKTAGGDMYDVTYDDATYDGVKVRLMLQGDSVAVGNMYKGEFIKCGDPFYGAWASGPALSASETLIGE